jgi:anionic cell wall polymer biosynthesis LytR-Cps2A-Psr (LCP) family protein
VSDQSDDGLGRNENRLIELGNQIDRSTGSTGKSNRHGRPRSRHRRQRWSTKRKIVTALATIVLLLGGLATGGYLYLHYEWGRVHKIACTSCTDAASGKPFNVLVIGSDTRAGNTGQAAQSFGSASAVGGQRSDTIKIVRVDPSSGAARILSIPRDTYVTMSGLAESSGLTGAQKINTA